MPVPKELVQKISEYEKTGYSPHELIQGIKISETYPDMAKKVNDYLSQGYTAEQILKGLKESPVEQPKRTGIFKQFQRVGDIYQEEVESGLKSMQGFAEKPTGKTGIKAGLGLMQYLTSPLTAVGKGVFREPVEETTRALGAPEIVTKFLGEAAETSAYILPYAKMVQNAIKGGEALRVAKEAERTSSIFAKKIIPEKEVVKAKPPLEFPTPPSPELVKEMAATGKLSKPIVQEGIQKQVADAAIEVIAKSPVEEGKRIGQQIIDLVNSQQINWRDLPDILKKYNITPEEFAQRLKDTYSAAGRTLGRLSIVARRVRLEVAKNPEAAKFYDSFIKELPEPTDLDKFINVFRNIESARRGLLVTQLATAMRNATSQVARATIGALDDSFQGLIRGTVGGQGNTMKQIGEGLDTATAFFHRFSPRARENLTRILESDAGTLAKARLLSTPVHEIAIVGKVTNTLNAANKLQEYFFRRMGFEAKLMQLLKREGLDIKNIDPRKITTKMWEEAVDHGLNISFAASPKSQFGKKFFETMNQPIFTALLNPFPRFAYGNALPYIWNFSPISLLKAMNPKVVAELATGNPDKFANHASKAVLGISQLAMGLYLRNSAHRGEKWYEVKVGESVYDTRSYAPLLSPYLLMAEGMTHPDRVEPADWAQAVIGLNRISGTGLVMVDVLRTGGIDNAAKTVSKLAGAYLGSFSVPAKTWNDIYGAIEPEATVIRDVKERPITGPFMRNVPVLSQTLPASVSPLKSEPPRSEAPLLRQLTGLSKRTKTVLEKEVDQLQLDFKMFYPVVGVPKAESLLASYMGPALERLAPKIIETEKYKNLETPVKRMVMRELFKEAKRGARIKLSQTHPGLYKQIKWEGLDRDIKEYLGERIQLQGK